jgi:hypothetical protein
MKMVIIKKIIIEVEIPLEMKERERQKYKTINTIMIAIGTD